METSTQKFGNLITLWSEKMRLENLLPSLKEKREIELISNRLNELNKILKNKTNENIFKQTEVPNLRNSIYCIIFFN